MHKIRQLKLFTDCNDPVCAQHGHEYGVVKTAMTSTEMGDEFHRSEEKKREKHGTFEQQKAWCCCWSLQSEKHYGKTGKSLTAYKRAVSDLCWLCRLCLTNQWCKLCGHGTRLSKDQSKECFLCSLDIITWEHVSRRSLTCTFWWAGKRVGTYW